MVTQSQITELCKIIVQFFQPHSIILFGSYGYGKPMENSDVDLLIILPYAEQNAFKSWEILNKANPKFPVDIMVRTPQQIQQRIELNDFFIKEIIEKGKVLYDSNNQRIVTGK